MREFGIFVLATFDANQAEFQSLNHWWAERVPLMPPEGQAVATMMSGGGRCKVCPFSSYRTARANLDARDAKLDAVITESTFNADVVSAGAAYPLTWLTEDPSASYEQEVRARSLLPSLNPN